ncbi:hypothetical protein [Jannaschia sp. LMIT008]|uniref:hypothetical protein n=1 Tax=Jannaschia maritima TaxID=3032585 RepID=UPI0028114896|nr:hypothetical protein [Jannaschia sp. LMIT008]
MADTRHKRTSRQAASDAVDSVRSSARELTAEARAQIEDAAEERKRAAAERISRVADAVHDAADALDGELGVVADYVHAGADRLSAVAYDVHDRGIGELTDSARRFARRQPLAVAGLAALVGFAAIRLVTAPASDAYDDGYDGHDDYDEYDEYDHDDGVRRDAVPAAAFEDAGNASGDPGGVAPEAPGFGEDDEGEPEADGTASTRTGGATSAGGDAGASQAKPS